MGDTARINREATDDAPGRFGTFGGVFTPSILTILGVIMFMRAGFVVGRAGVGCALLTLLVCKVITVLTGFSIAGISTNTRVRGGGAYFMISRSLGPEFGGAIGLALFFAQALSVPFYILGFTEALTRSVPGVEEHYLAVTLITALILCGVTYVGAQWAIRAQYIILSVLVISIITFLGGAALNFRMATFRANFAPAAGYDFWRVFAIYFPAVTGIMAGVNMSGDLKNPTRSIPRGTFLALGVGLLVYGAQMVISGGAAGRDMLTDQPFEMLVEQALLGMGFFVLAGVFAATLSSAIGSFLGAPRVLQALARDRIFTTLGFFARCSGPNREPRRGLALTFAITLAVLISAGSGGSGKALNMVAAVVTMFFLYTYGMINLAAFVESFGSNPSFRPRFRWFHWTLAAAGTVGCGGAAFLISPVAAVVSALVIGVIYFVINRRLLEMAFGDARRGFVYSRVRANLLRLSQRSSDPKNWRPTVLVLTGNPATRGDLLTFGNWLECDRGILTLAEILVGDFDEVNRRRLAAVERMRGFLKELNAAAFPEVMVAPTLDWGIAALLQGHSIGPLKPNVVLVGWAGKPERREIFERHLRMARALGMSLGILVPRGFPKAGAESRIDVWWRGRENGYLMLILSHLLASNWEWSRGRVRVLRLVGNEAGRVPAGESLDKLIEAARIDAETEVVVSQRPFREVLQEHSGDAGLIMLGFTVSDDGERPVFPPSYVSMVEQSLPSLLLVCSTGEADPMA